jgi:HSP20 family protein
MVFGPKREFDKLILLHQEMDKLFNDIFTPIDRENSLDGFFVPSMDQFETAEHLHFEIDLPGINQDNLSVSILEKKIIVEGSKPPFRCGADGRYMCAERKFGNFRRTIELHDTCDTNCIEAVLLDGVLSIKIPKIKDRRGARRKIEIRCE